MDLVKEDPGQPFIILILLLILIIKSSDAAFASRSRNHDQCCVREQSTGPNNQLARTINWPEQLTGPHVAVVAIVRIMIKSKIRIKKLRFRAEGLSPIANAGRSANSRGPAAT